HHMEEYTSTFMLFFCAMSLSIVLGIIALKGEWRLYRPLGRMIGRHI
ncbi:MAG: hypothetical protein ACI82H_002327, partial [Alphaproteobacteria bacterium]